MKHVSSIVQSFWSMRKGRGCLERRGVEKRERALQNGIIGNDFLQ